METKRCNSIHCNKVKPVAEFYSNSASPDGIDYRCKECRKAASRNVSQSTKAKKKAYLKQWKEQHAEHVSQYNKAYLSQYYRDNKEAMIKQTTAYAARRRKEDVEYRLIVNLRRRLHHALRGQSKSETTLTLLGCGIEDLRMHLASKFVPGMSWENYGPVWHVDHIKPLALFDLSDDKQIAEACNYSNLQPLFARDNIVKGKRYKD